MGRLLTVKIFYMLQAVLELFNKHTTDLVKAAQTLVDLFDWAILGHGTTMETGYLRLCSDGQTSLYCLAQPSTRLQDLNSVKGGLKYIGFCVADIATTEARIKKMGFITHFRAYYEPGHRFYFREDDGAKFEIVSCNAD